MRREIRRPDGRLYMAVSMEDGRLKLESIGEGQYTVYLDEKIIEPLIPILQEFKFWRRTTKQGEQL